MSITVIKGNGKTEPFSEAKIAKVIKRVGGEDALIHSIIEYLEKKYDGQKVTTKELFKQIKKIINESNPRISRKLNLKHAIQRLGPAGYDFEKFVAAILRAHGYKAELPPILQGACITHEVDVTAEKYGRTAMIEAKFRRSPGEHISIKDTMSTWARHIDLVDGAQIGVCPHLDEAWIVTNARFSQQSLQYGHCKNMVLLGWNHPKEHTLQNMIDIRTMYPVTIFEDIPNRVVKKLAENNIMLCSELAETPEDKLLSIFSDKKDIVQKLIHECDILLGDN